MRIQVRIPLPLPPPFPAALRATKTQAKHESALDADVCGAAFLEALKEITTVLRYDGGSASRKLVDLHFAPVVLVHSATPDSRQATYQEASLDQGPEARELQGAGHLLSHWAGV